MSTAGRHRPTFARATGLTGAPPPPAFHPRYREWCGPSNTATGERPAHDPAPGTAGGTVNKHKDIR